MYSRSTMQSTIPKKKSLPKKLWKTTLLHRKVHRESISASLPTNQSQLLCRRINLNFSLSPPPKNLSAASQIRCNGKDSEKMLIEWRLMHGSPCLMKIRYIIWKKAAKRKAKYEKFPKVVPGCF
ncbi:hypothetical protein P8452_17168 [Trifolium repens]|nr:hypothetical protein P8452_17168 [Trifolium repens]